MVLQEPFLFPEGFPGSRGQDAGTASEDQGDLTPFLCLGSWTLSGPQWEENLSHPGLQPGNREKPLRPYAVILEF